MNKQEFKALYSASRKTTTGREVLQGAARLYFTRGNCARLGRDWKPNLRAEQAIRLSLAADCRRQLGLRLATRQLLERARLIRLGGRL